MKITLPRIIVVAIVSAARLLSLVLVNQTMQFAGPEDCGKTSEWLNVCPVNFAPGGGCGPGYIRRCVVALGIKF